MGIADVSGKLLWLRGQDLGAGGSTIASWANQATPGGSATGVNTTALTVEAASTPLGGKAVLFGTNGSFTFPLAAVSASSSTGSETAAKAVDQSTASFWTTAVGIVGWIRLDYVDTLQVGAYRIRRRDTLTTRNPSAWTFEGSNDGTSWTVLDTQTGQTWPTANEYRTYTLSSSVTYSKYRLNITANNGDASYTSLAEFSVVPTGVDLWIVTKGGSASVSRGLWRAGEALTSSDAALYPFGSDNKVYESAGMTAPGNRQSFAPTVAIDSWRIYRVRNDGTTWQAWLDNTSQATASSKPVHIPADFLIGLANGQNYNGGRVAEVLVFNRALGSTDAATVYDYLVAEHITAPSGVTGAASLSGALGVLVSSGVVTTTGAATATGPLGALSAAGFGPTTGGAVLTGPLGSLTAIGVVVTTGGATVTGPLGALEAVGTSDNTALGFADLTGPLGALTAAGTVITTGAAALTGPLGAVAAVGDATPPSVAGANLVGPLGTLTAEGVVSAGPVIVSTTRTPVGILSVLPLVPVAPLATAVPITRVSVLAPDLSAAHPAHPAPGEPGAPAVVEEVVGYPQLFIGGRNVTNLRGVQTLIRRWESEAPFGDTAAAFEFPQLNPWDEPGAGDLDFLGRDAPVAIGIREEVAPGAFRVRRLWSGFLDARGNGLGEGEDYSWEAKGTFWQAQSFLREPHPLPASEPVDIGVWIARVMNAVDGRRWATMPLTPIGITTRTRGHRGQYAMEYVQELLSEAITDDFRQWTLLEVAPGVPRLVLKPAPTEVHATVAYGTPGVDVDLRIDESTRVDRIFMRGIGKNAGGWANIFYPWLYKIDDAPPYPMADPATNITLGTTDADTVSGSGVTDFQRRVDELDGFANPAVSGVMSSAWMAVVDDLQRRLNLPVGPLNSTTWERVFDGRPNLEGIKPRRLPMASKPEAEKYLYDADGRRLPGVNPAWDGRVPRDIEIDAGVGKGKAEGFKLARKILGLFGEAAANGQIVWTTDPKETDRTRLSHLSNVKVTGFEGRDVVVQVSQKSVELDAGDKAYVVTTRVDERARDAMVVEDLLNQRREAKADPSRRPGVTNRASRQVADQRTTWDIESPCGKLRRTAVPSGGWKIRHIPFAEVGKLASISIDSTRPFAFAIFASLRITEAHLNAKGSPFASADFWRDNKDYFDQFGIVEAWGEQDDACGYSPKSEADGGSFTGKFRLDTPVDYWTETPPVVAVAFYMRGGSGWVEGGQDADGVRRGFVPAYES